MVYVSHTVSEKRCDLKVKSFHGWTLCSSTAGCEPWKRVNTRPLNEHPYHLDMKKFSKKEVRKNDSFSQTQ